MKTIRLNIQYADDREKIILGLSNSSYKVWVEKEDYSSWKDETKYFVVFELNE